MRQDPLSELAQFFRRRGYPPPPRREEGGRTWRPTRQWRHRLGRFAIDAFSKAFEGGTGSLVIKLYDYNSEVATKYIDSATVAEAEQEVATLLDIARRIPRDTPSWQIEGIVSGRRAHEP